MFSRAQIQSLCERSAERGNFVEAGWTAFRLQVVQPGFDECDVEQMRMAFFGGSLWMFSDLMQAMQLSGLRLQEPLLSHIVQLNQELANYVQDIDSTSGIRP